MKRNIKYIWAYPIVWVLEAIVWLFKPRLYRVGTDIDEDFAKHLLSYGAKSYYFKSTPKRKVKGK